MGRSGLTMTEREHWKKRIQARIQQHIDRIIADNPGLMPDLLAKAQKQAYKDLGIDKLRDKRAKLLQQQKQINEDLQATDEAITCAVLELTPGAYRVNSYSHDRNLEEALRKRIAVIRQKLLAKDEVGRRIIGLQKESEEVLDTVWLATSPQQVKDLWERVLSYLNENVGDLQREAMSLPALDGLDGGKAAISDDTLDTGLDDFSECFE